MALIKEPYGLVYNTDGTLCITYRDDNVPFRGVRSFAVETATTNLSPQTVGGQEGIVLVYKGEENGWKKYGISGTWNSGTYPYCAAIGQVAFTGGEYYSTSAFFKTNCQEKFATYFESIIYTNLPMISKGTAIRRVLNDGSIYLARVGFAYQSSTSQPGYLTLRPKQDGETFNPNQHFLYVKNIQTEQKPFATSFVDGSRPSGKIKIEMPFDIGNLVISGWVKVNGWRDWTQLFCVGKYYTENESSFGVWLNHTENVLRIFTTDGQDARYASTAYTRAEVENWSFFVFIKDGDFMTIKMLTQDNTYTSSITRAFTNPFDQVIYVGTDRGYDRPLNGLFSNIFIGKYRRDNGTVIWTDDYIREVYEAQMPFAVQNQLSIY